MNVIPRENLEKAADWFEESFRTRWELGASVSVWKDGREIMSLANGFRDRQRRDEWTADTLVPVWSATKGPAAACCLLALHESRLDIDAPVQEVWPEFVGGGKQEVTFAQILTHTAGLCALNHKTPIYDFEEVVAALEVQPPLWDPGQEQGYHARTFGFLCDEIVRRITGAESLGEYFRVAIADPMELDFWIGLPEKHHHRVASIYPGRISIAQQDQRFLKAYNTAGTMTHAAFSSLVGLNAVQDFNQPETWTRGYASMGGVGSASALGKFYAMLAQGGVWSGQQILPPEVLGFMEARLTQSEDDRVLCAPVAFGAGFMKDPLDPETGEKVRMHFGSSHRAFGHPGAGGSLAFADPDNGIAFAYVMNQMEVGAFPGDKSLGIVDRLYGAV
mgnify:CR=1 FL=1